MLDQRPVTNNKHHVSTKSHQVISNNHHAIAYNVLHTARIRTCVRFNEQRCRDATKLIAAPATFRMTKATTTMIRSLHTFLDRHAFYPLALSSALAIITIIGRIYDTRSPMYLFLVWNLVLAWLPYMISLWADARVRRTPDAWWRLLLPGALWLLFFPNAPYIVTDFVHFRHNTGVPWWYDVGMLGLFAWSGCFLGVVSLQTMQMIATRFVGRVGSWLFVLGAVGLSGLGVYMGRVLRWNSWDVLTDPTQILRDIAFLILHPRHNTLAFGFSAMFAALTLVCYLTFVSVARRDRQL